MVFMMNKNRPYNSAIDGIDAVVVGDVGIAVPPYFVPAGLPVGPLSLEL